MPEYGAKHIIRTIQKKWMVSGMLSYFIKSSAFCLFVATFVVKFAGQPLWFGMAAFLTPVINILTDYNSFKISETEVARFLNQRFPQLEESSGLLLQPYDSLNMLEKLQQKKVERMITQLPAPVSFNKKLMLPLLIMVAAIAVCTALFYSPLKNPVLEMERNADNNISGVKPSTVLPNISSVQVTITPPAYTGNSFKSQSIFNIKAAEGSDIHWQLTTTIPADTLQLVMNGSMVPLHSINNDHTLWSVDKNCKSSGFYQVKLNGKLSELYSIDLVKDAPPVISIQKPASYTIIDYGQPQQVAMSVTIEDDYGIREAVISATTTSGSGEGVKFKEQQLSFVNFKSGRRKYNLQKTLDLPVLGVKPGDELYFYVRSVDNHSQESRSDVYMVSVPDTAQLMSLEGLAGGVNIKPEYFRSERQIIIETEQLLKDQKTLSVEAFKNKSNDLGIDQKLLRLRYSKFLGGESEGAEEEGHDHEADNNTTTFGNAEKILDEVSHKHDNAEDASFFDVQTKKQLMATLDEMWNAESRLRTLKPQEALPFEYKALRLLKDLQEKGRSYVAKAGFKTTPLQPEKRLSGDLSQIKEPVTQTDFKNKENPEDAIRRALGVLENMKAGTGISKTSLETLQQAAVQLNKRASAEPSVYLTSVGAMNRVLEASANVTVYSTSDITAAQKGLQRLVSAPAALPGPDKKNPDQNLSKHYFNILQQGNR